MAELAWDWRYDLERTPGDMECSVGTELRFVTQSVILSFYIPLVIILIAYFKIYQASRIPDVALNNWTL